MPPPVLILCFMLLTVAFLSGQTLDDCGLRTDRGLRRVLLSNANAVCNDGTQAGYYIQKSYGSKRWIVFLEGGWYCFDNKSCYNRWNQLPSLMSSSDWPKYRHVGGILSSDPQVNPFWWNTNRVFVPYCSSDSWSGTVPLSDASPYAFMGSHIVQEVIHDLVVSRGLKNNTMLILAGSSAGGTGVILNLDRVSEILVEEGLNVEVRGISDSGWFLDNAPYSPMDCTEPAYCSPVDAVRLGVNLWGAKLPPSCHRDFPLEPWRCFFGYHVFANLKTPLFVVQYMFDEAQMTADNVGAPTSKEQWNYVHRMGRDLRKTFENVSAVFAPSCISHTVLTKRDWKHIQVNGVTLPEALRCWELRQPRKLSHRYIAESNSIAEDGENADREAFRRKRLRKDYLSDSPISQGLHLRGRSRSRSPNNATTIITTNSTRRRYQEGDVEEVLNKDNRRMRRRRKHKRRRNRGRKNGQKNARAERKRQRQGQQEKNSRALRSVFDIHPESLWTTSESEPRCQHRLIDRCSWPQCNLFCPKLLNPATGEEMDFIDLLKSFGVDMPSVANALGIDLHTLNNMDHEELQHLLTQQTS